MKSCRSIESEENENLNILEPTRRNSPNLIFFSNFLSFLFADDFLVFRDFFLVSRTEATMPLHFLDSLRYLNSLRFQAH